MKRIFTILACIFTAAVFMPAAVAGIILAVIKLKGKNKQD